MKVYTTSDDEREAREIAENLNSRRHRALVMSVSEMHMYGIPEAPKTANRWAVIVEDER